MTNKPPLKMSRKTQTDIGLSNKHMTKDWRLDHKSEWWLPKITDPRGAGGETAPQKKEG